jgi:hypothetical protein
MLRSTRLANRPRSGHLITAALGAGFLTVVSLVLPWFDLLGKKRSSIDILRSASALDVIDGFVKVVVLAGWLLAPVLVAMAMPIAASGRHRAAAALLVPVGVGVLAAALFGALVDDIDLVWGAIFGAVFAATASVFAIMVLVAPRVST